MFCRHESFSLGASFSAVLHHESKFGPYFASGGLPLQDARYPSSQRKLGEESKYKKPSVSETEGPKKSIAIEEKLIQKGETSCTKHSSDYVELERQTSEAVDSKEIIQEDKCNEDLGEVDNGKEEKDLGLSHTSASSSQINEETFNTNNNGPASEVPEPKKSGSTEIIGNAMKLSVNVKSRAAEGIDDDDDDKTEEPLYDSSPSEIEKRTIEESFFCMDKEVAPIAADLMVEVPEIGSPQVERTIAYRDPAAILNVNGNAEISSGNNEAMEKDGSTSTEVIKIIKCDVEDGLTDTKHDFNGSYTALIEQEPAAKQVQMASVSDSLQMDQSKEEVKNQIPSSSSHETHAGVH